MLIFLYGQDTFRLSRKLAEIIEEYKKQTRGLEFAVFDALAGNTADFFSGLRQNSLFGGKKFFVVKNPVSDKGFKERLISEVEKLSLLEHNMVFCQEGKVLKADRLLKAFAKHARVQEFAPLAGARLNAWIAAEFEKTNSRVAIAAIEALAARVGGDLWRAANEIQKLAHFARGREITAADIDNAIPPAPEANIFAVVDAAAARDTKKALLLIKERVQKGDHPIYLLAIIASQFKNLFLVKGARKGFAAPLPGMHPYVFKKTLSQSKKFSLPDLQKIYRRICQTDFDIKTGKIDPEAGLDLLLAEM